MYAVEVMSVALRLCAEALKFLLFCLSPVDPSSTFSQGRRQPFSSIPIQSGELFIITRVYMCLLGGTSAFLAGEKCPKV